MIKKITLSNGVRVLMERMDSAATAAVGVFVKNGAVDEDKKNAGISHFIEHMLFKGTKTRSAREIAFLTDQVGGNMNAYTAKEYTCYYAKVLSEDIMTPIEILSDMYFNPLFSEKDIEVEKNVVIEEINMYEDSPEDLVCDLLCEDIFKGCRLSNPILGTVKSVKGLTKDTLEEFIARRYTPKNTVVSIAGRFDEEEVLKAVEDKFGGYSRETEQKEMVAVPYRRTLSFREKEIEQNHLCFGFPGLCYDHEDIYALSVLSAVFGGGMSSRLFQRLREEKGLCYGIYSFSAAHEETGIFAIHMALNQKSEKRALREVLSEIRRAVRGFTPEEIEMGKHQVRASFLMGMESTSSRMQSNARREVIKSETKAPDELLERLESVTAKEVNGLSERLLGKEGISLAVVGDLKNREEFKKALSF